MSTSYPQHTAECSRHTGFTTCPQISLLRSFDVAGGRQSNFHNASLKWCSMLLAFRRSCWNRSILFKATNNYFSPLTRTTSILNLKVTLFLATLPGDQWKNRVIDSGAAHVKARATPIFKDTCFKREIMATLMYCPCHLKCQRASKQITAAHLGRRLI